MKLSQVVVLELPQDGGMSWVAVRAVGSEGTVVVAFALGVDRAAGGSCRGQEEVLHRVSAPQHGVVARCQQHSCFSWRRFPPKELAEMFYLSKKTWRIVVNNLAGTARN